MVNAVLHPTVHPISNGMVMLVSPSLVPSVISGMVINAQSIVKIVQLVLTTMDILAFPSPTTAHLEPNGMDKFV